MIGQTNPYILNNKKQRLLRGTMTDAERSLWRSLCGRQMGGYKFRRQHPFGDFILDFICLEKRLVIEVDGGQHGEQLEADFARTDRLTQSGFRVLRFWNHEVLMQTEAVQTKILSALQVRDEAHPHLASP
jgi:very-short-patch-repair endonuclease